MPMASRKASPSAESAAGPWKRGRRVRRAIGGGGSAVRLAARAAREEGKGDGVEDAGKEMEGEGGDDEGGDDEKDELLLLLDDDDDDEDICATGWLWPAPGSSQTVP